MFRFLVQYTLNPDFLSVIAAVEAAVLAFLIPLSFEMITRISERYQSEVVSEPFRKEWLNVVLPYLLVFNILAAVILICFDETCFIPNLWSVFAWMTLGSFILIVILILWFFARLKWYMTNIDFILNRLFSDAEKHIR